MQNRPPLWFGLGSLLGPAIHLAGDPGQSTSLWASVSLGELGALNGFHTELRGVLRSSSPSSPLYPEEPCFALFYTFWVP